MENKVAAPAMGVTRHHVSSIRFKDPETEKDRLPAMRQIVTLHLSDGSHIGSMGVRPNRHGQLPALIVDPRDSTGRVLLGMWLGDVQDRYSDGTSYRELTRDV
jgi:hypothetical protein